MTMQLAILLLITKNVLAVPNQDYTETMMICSNIPDQASFDNNLQYLWGKVILQNVDRYAFLIVSPLLVLLELIILKFYYHNPKILGQPGILYVVILAFELMFNIHFIASAAYYTSNESGLSMPDSFPAFCKTTSVLTSFFQIFHFIFLLMVPLYIIYVLRRTLKSNAKIWTIVYIIVFILSGGMTFLFWYEGLLGLNIFGLCQLTFMRTPRQSLIIPILIIASNVIFLIAGIFTIRYFKRHMPNSLGLREKRYYQKQVLVVYVVGYSLFYIAQAVIQIFLYFNCQADHPFSGLQPLVTIYNILRILECFLIFFIIFKLRNVRTAFKKFLKRWLCCSQKPDLARLSIMTQSQKNNENDVMNFQEVFLEIKQQKNEIDILKISQVVTIVSGIYIAYKQYYNIDYFYFNNCVMSIDRSSLSKNEIENRRKQVNFKATKHIYFHEKMSIKLSANIIKDFIIDLSLIPKLGVLECTMIIHAPKIFQLMLESDNLQDIYSSFELHNNTRKMFDLAQGQGGRSGEFFFFSRDNKYVLKTITPDQFQFIESNLMFFFEHFVRNPDSVLAKIYGLFTFHGDQIQRTYHLILMKNILACTNDQIVRTYDMKGSRYDRQVNHKGEIAANELKKMTLKDIDFMKEEGKIHIRNYKKIRLRQIIEKDTIFLKNLNLLDYSLLVVRVKWNTPPQNQQFWGQYQRIPSFLKKHEYYHIGIIDYLQRWDLQKKGEKWWKRFLGKKDFSAQEPKQYQKRFVLFIHDITGLFHEGENSLSECKSVQSDNESAQKQQRLSNGVALNLVKKHFQLYEEPKHKPKPPSHILQEQDLEYAIQRNSDNTNQTRPHPSEIDSRFHQQKQIQIEMGRNSIAEHIQPQHHEIKKLFSQRVSINERFLEKNHILEKRDFNQSQ